MIEGIVYSCGLFLLALIAILLILCLVFQIAQCFILKRHTKMLLRISKCKEYLSLSDRSADFSSLEIDRILSFIKNSKIIDETTIYNLINKGESK